MMPDNNNQKVSDDQQQAGQPGAGELLKSARERSGLSQEDVCRQLGITQRMIDALESDNYDKLSGPTYVKGYIKRYCKLVKISDAEPLSAFDRLCNEHGYFQKREYQFIPPKMPLGKKILMWLIISILVLAIAAAAYWVAQLFIASAEAMIYTN